MYVHWMGKLLWMELPERICFQEITCLTDACVFAVIFFLKACFMAPIAATASLNDIQLLHKLLPQQQILQKLWLLNSRVLVFAVRNVGISDVWISCFDWNKTANYLNERNRVINLIKRVILSKVNFPTLDSLTTINSLRLLLKLQINWKF